MTDNTINLAGVFETVTQALSANQQALNSADSINQDHGDHMVETFQTITHALQEKQGSNDALAYAAQVLSQKANSGSGKLYAEGLAQAADQLKGKSIDSNTAMQLLQTLIGGGQAQQPVQPEPAQSTGDLLGSLLGGMTGSANNSQQNEMDMGSLLGGLLGNDTPAPNQNNAPDMGSLIGSLMGNSSAKPSQDDGLDMGDLLNAGMAFFQSKQQGKDNLSAAIAAFMAASGMGKSAHRNQSTQLVVNTFLQALSQANR